MALKATVVRAELQLSDMDRHHYAHYPLTLAQHPSETEERLMVRLLAFALHADERLEFGRGLSTDEDPDLWQRDYGGEVERWIELGQPDESRIRKACGRSRQVTVVNYGGRAAGLWWEKNAGALARHGNLTVLDLPQPEDNAHYAKLEAFLDWLQAPASLRQFHHVWNGVTPGALPTPDLPAWRTCVQAARARLHGQDDLATQLLGFVARKG